MYSKALWRSEKFRKEGLGKDVDFWKETSYHYHINYHKFIKKIFCLFIKK